MKYWFTDVSSAVSTSLSVSSMRGSACTTGEANPPRRSRGGADGAEVGGLEDLEERRDASATTRTGAAGVSQVFRPAGAPRRFGLHRPVGDAEAMAEQGHRRCLGSLNKERFVKCSIVVKQTRD